MDGPKGWPECVIILIFEQNWQNMCIISVPISLADCNVFQMQ